MNHVAATSNRMKFPYIRDRWNVLSMYFSIISNKESTRSTKRVQIFCLGHLKKFRVSRFFFLFSFFLIEKEIPRFHDATQHEPSVRARFNFQIK